MPYEENMHVNKLCFSMNYSAVGCEFNVEELTMYIK